MFKFIKNLFKTKVINFPKNTSWMLNKDLSINIKNIKHCREFQVLNNIKQNKYYHGEGNAYNHTLLVAKEMHNIIKNQLSHLPYRDKKVLMIAALCHDLGKATTTYYDNTEKTWRCKNHGIAGERITRDLIFNEKDNVMREEVCWLVRWHMSFHYFISKDYDDRMEELIRLAQGNSSIEKLLWLNVADCLGSKSKENTKEIIDNHFDIIKSMAEECKCYNAPYKKHKDKSEFNMYIMIGLPGSGKDTYIKRYLPNTKTICRDDIREEYKYREIRGRKLMLSPKEEAMVTNIVNNMIRECCENKKSFVINQTNVKKKYREELKKQALKYGNPNIIYIYVEPESIEICKKRRGYGKWDDIINKMWSEFEMPDRSECDELITYKQK